MMTAILSLAKRVTPLAWVIIATLTVAGLALAVAHHKLARAQATIAERDEQLEDCQQSVARFATALSLADAQGKQRAAEAEAAVARARLEATKHQRRAADLQARPVPPHPEQCAATHSLIQEELRASR